MTSLKRTGNKDEVDEANADDASVVEAVLEASRALVAIAARSLVGLDADVTLAQYRVMVVLSRCPGLTVSDLAAELSVGSSTVTRLCDRLVRKGLIRRQRAKVDRRQAAIFLTSFGRQLIAEVMDRRREELRRILDRLSPLQQREVVRALSVFTQAADEGSSYRSTQVGGGDKGRQKRQKAATPEADVIASGDLKILERKAIEEWPI